MVHDIVVPAEWAGIMQLMSFTDVLDGERTLSDEQRYLARLAIEEISTNIVKYGVDDRAGRIHVGCSIEDGTLRLVIRDTGRPFDPRLVAEPEMSGDILTRDVGGLGLFLVRSLADELSYTPDDGSGWNELVVVKRAAIRAQLEEAGDER